MCMRLGCAGVCMRGRNHRVAPCPPRLPFTSNQSTANPASPQPPLTSLAREGASMAMRVSYDIVPKRHASRRRWQRRAPAEAPGQKDSGRGCRYGSGTGPHRPNSLVAVSVSRLVCMRVLTPEFACGPDHWTASGLSCGYRMPRLPDCLFGLSRECSAGTAPGLPGSAVLNPCRAGAGAPEAWMDGRKRLEVEGWRQ